MKRLVCGAALVTVLCIGAGDVIADPLNVDVHDAAVREQNQNGFGAPSHGVFALVVGASEALIRVLRNFADFKDLSSDVRQAADAAAIALKDEFELQKSFAKDLEVAKSNTFEAEAAYSGLTVFAEKVPVLITAEASAVGLAQALVIALANVVKAITLVPIRDFNTREAIELTDILNLFTSMLSGASNKLNGLWNEGNEGNDLIVAASKIATPAVSVAVDVIDAARKARDSNTGTITNRTDHLSSEKLHRLWSAPQPQKR